MINPGAQEALSFLAKRKLPALCSVSAEEARRIVEKNDALVSNEGPPVAIVERLEIDNDGHALPVTLYRGQGCPAKDAPCIVFVHGGGWVLGASRSHDEICRLLANAAGCAVLFPDYRLAPEFRFPAGLSDVARTVEHARRSASELGISPALIGICGDSAGGNLATVAAGLARSRDHDPLVAQLLFYPNTDASLTFASYQTYSEGFGLTAADMRWFRDHYIDNLSLVSDWRVSPLKNPDLAGLPPTHLVIAGLDILRDEGVAYARALASKGVATDLRIMDDLIHGYVSMGKFVKEARETVETAASFFVTNVEATRALRG